MTSASAWAASGAMALTGDAEGPPLVLPWPVAFEAAAVTQRFGLDAGVLAERAAAAGFSRNGRVSCGGATRLLRARDGWLAVSLARDDDLALLPALLGIEAAARATAWPSIADRVASRPVAEVDETAALLGFPCRALGAHEGPLEAHGRSRTGCRAPVQPVVIDLSALWAGPLCTHLLRRAGARVIKVEDRARPDGARWGATSFFDLLNAGKESVVLDFRSPRGRSQLVSLLEAADVVVTSARARAFDQLGITVTETLATRTDKVWTAVTAYGWESSGIGFGDDVAAAAGLVAWHPRDGEPRFASDAIADPLCGLAAAAATMDCVAAGGRWFVDASLAGAAVRARGSAERAETASCDAGVNVAQPRVRRPQGSTPAFGSDTEAVLAELAG